MKKTFAMPKEAIEVWEAMAETELTQSSWWLYASACLGHHGYHDASKWAFSRAEDERYHFKEIVDYCEGRGVEMDVPAIPAPKINFTDLKTLLAEAMDNEVEDTMKYDEAFKMMQPIDSMSYIELQMDLTNQMYRLQNLTRLIKLFEGVESVEDQKEAEKAEWGYKGEECMPIAS